MRLSLTRYAKSSSGGQPVYDHPALTTREDFGLLHHSTVGEMASTSRTFGVLHAPHQPVETDERIVCHCFHVSQSEVQVAAAVGAADTLRDVMDCTGAGTGCTACHRRIRQILNSRGAQSPEPSPICIAR